jgi:hypothetical protein
MRKKRQAILRRIAEEAEAIVSEVFSPAHIEVERWDAPMVVLHDHEEVAAYVRSHLLPPQVVDEVEPPITLTKRGCLVWARRPLSRG